MSIDRTALKEFRAAPAPRQSLGKPAGAAPASSAAPVTPVTPVATPTQDPPATSSAPAAVVDASAVAPADSTPALAPASAPADSAPAGDQQAAPTDGGEAPEGSQPNGKPRSQERIEDLHAQLKATREYAEYQARVIQDMTARTAAPAAAAPTAPAASAPATDDPAPTLEQHDFDAAKLATAQAEWLDRQVNKRVAAAVQGQTAQQQAQVAREAFIARVETFKATTPDFDIVTANPALPPLNPVAAKLVVHSEKGPQITYHLAKNPNVAAHIARMAPEQQAMAIGRLEAQLSAPAAAAPPARQKQSTTQAPPPPSAAPSGGAAGAPSDPSRMSMKEFVENERRLAAERRAKLKTMRGR